MTTRKKASPRSFLSFLMRFVDVDEDIGDLARETKLDTCLWQGEAPLVGTWRALYEHIEAVHNGSAIALRAVLVAARRRQAAMHAREGKSWWLDCAICPPFIDGTRRKHYIGARNRVAREHLRIMWLDTQRRALHSPPLGDTNRGSTSA